MAGRVRKNELSLCAAHKALIAFPIERVAAEEIMVPHAPEIAGLRDCGPCPVDPRVRRRLHPRPFAELTDENIGLGGLKAGHGDIEVELDRQLLKLDRQELAVPACELGKPIVGNHIGPDLCWRQMVGAHCRDSGHAEQLCGLDPAMARYDAVRAVDQDRIDKAEFLDTGSNLSDLLWAMRARIAVPAPKLGRIFIGYLEGGHNHIY